MGHPGTFHFRELVEEVSNGVYGAGVFVDASDGGLRCSIYPVRREAEDDDAALATSSGWLGVTVFVAVLGAAPGVSKSVLCTVLARTLAAGWWSVDHFREARMVVV